jgi:hypothetical protein
LSQLVCYRKRAPFYSQVIEIVEKMFQTKYEKIVDLNIIALETVCNYLQIPFNYTVYSKSQKSINELVHSPGEWALYIAKSYQAEIYINPYGGEEIFNRDQYQKEGIEIKFLKNDLTPYNQRRGRFEPGLSIIDVMMFNSPEECLNLINQYQLT